MDGPKPRVLILLPLVGDPRDSKRIAMLQEAGLTVEALAFERDYHQGRMPSCSVTSLGRIPHGQYLRRVLRLLAALPVFRRALRRSDVAYASGADMALAGLVAGIGLGRPMVLEVGDIRAIQVAPGWKGALMRALDRWIARRSGLLVVTAPGFADGYYRDRLRVAIPSLVIENKLDAQVMPAHDVASAAKSPPLRAADGTRRPIRVGYFGVLRCDWSWNLLEAMATRHPDEITLVVAGYPMSPPDLVERAKALPNATYLGQYRSPQDLPSMYERVDVVWMCYPDPSLRDPEWRWAQEICRSNRFYESCYFRTPTIALAQGADGVEVARLGIGLVLRDPADASIIEAIRAISDADLDAWRERLAALPRAIFIYTDESERLGRAVMDLAAGRALSPVLPGRPAPPPA